MAVLVLFVMAMVLEGSYYFFELLLGSLFWVSWDIVHVGVWVYGGVGLVHFLV